MKNQIEYDILEEDSSCIKAIIDNSRKSGIIKYSELLDCIISRGITEKAQIEDIISLVSDMGFKISRQDETSQSYPK